MMANHVSQRDTRNHTPPRRSNGESLQGRLHASSFPHRIFADIGRHLVDRLITTSEEEANDVHAVLLNEEERFSALDYIRYVELRRDHNDITLTVKRFLLDENTVMVRDARDTHEVLCSVVFNVEDSPSLHQLDALIDYLVDVYYHTVTPRRFQTGLDAVMWKADTRMTAAQRSRYDTHPTQRGHSTHLDTRDVKELLQLSLNKYQFHMALTPRCIQLFDQSKIISVR